MEFQKTLNEKIWDKVTNRTTGDSRFVLKREVRSRLKGIAHAFMDYNDIPESALKDIRVVGSSASYNYTEHSDLDLHLVIDSSKLHKDCPIVWSYLYALKTQFNIAHDITIYGIPVELYTEPVGQPANSNGIYSITDNKWVKEPKPIPPTDNDEAVKAKTEDLLKAIEWVEGNGNGEAAKEVLNKIYDMRKAGLAKGGEFSVENLAFKNLRNAGALDKLRAITKEDMDKELSLESLQEEKRNNKMEVTELIARLEAIRNYSKDIHYTVSHRAAYAEHLLADLVQDDIGDFIDDIKENVIMGGRELPKSSRVYLSEAVKYIPDIKEGDDRANFISLANLIDSVRMPLKDMDTPTRGTASLYDALGEKLDKMAGLLYMQTRLSDGLNEAKEDEMELEVKCDHEGCKQVPVDRKEYKQEVPSEEEQEKTAKKVVKQSEEELANIAAVTESLDRLAKRLGV